MDKEEKWKQEKRFQSGWGSVEWDVPVKKMDLGWNLCSTLQ